MNWQFVSRSVLLLLTVLLSCLSLLYAIAQLTESTIDDVHCDKKTIEDVWAHSKDIGSAVGNISMTNNYETSCWNSKRASLDIKKLFSNSSYGYKWNVGTTSLVKCCLFALLSMIYLFLFGHFILDFVQFHQNRNKIHSESKLEPLEISHSFRVLSSESWYKIETFYHEHFENDDFFIFIGPMFFGSKKNGE